MKFQGVGDGPVRRWIWYIADIPGFQQATSWFSFHTEEPNRMEAVLGFSLKGDTDWRVQLSVLNTRALRKEMLV